MTKRISFNTLLVLLFFTTQSFAQGYKIKVKIPKLKNQELILGHNFATMLIPDDTLLLNAKGEGYFKGKEKLKEGMYFIFLPSKSKFDIIVGKNQQFTVENDTVDLIKNLKIGDKENEIFIDYRLFLDKQRTKAKELTEERKTAKGDVQKEIDKQLQQINFDVKKKANSIIESGVFGIILSR